MARIGFCLALFLMLTVTGSKGLAQADQPDAILFIWNDKLLAQGIRSNELVTAPQHSLPPLVQVNVYDFAESPLGQPPSESYGFVQGVWSADQTRFAFLVLQPDDAGYQVIVWQDGQQQALLTGVVSPERGYLLPLGWDESGSLILLERYGLHHLDQVRLWRYDGAALNPQTVIPTPALKGNSASLGNGWVFVGFDPVGVQGYMVNLNSGQLNTFPTSFALQTPPASVFEVYPVDVVGVVNLARFKAEVESPPSSETTPAAPRTIEPFLYWPLPDDARSITCYPDSEWTDLNFALECPGLTVPRAYQGHEGTDVGGKPAGLPPGTPVYAAVPGLVIARQDGCPADDITCGDAYGNYVLLEHARLRGHDVETWFTGYAHLQTVLVDQHSYVHTIGLPIALSGSTGLGGAHLHFEVRAPHLPQPGNWVDPWDVRGTVGEAGLWIGGSERPQSAVVAFPPPTLLMCQTADGNNIRSGPGTEYPLVIKTSAQTSYEVFQVRQIETGAVPGEWYQVRWAGMAVTGWIYADLMTCAAAG